MRPAALQQALRRLGQTLEVRLPDGTPEGKLLARGKGLLQPLSANEQARFPLRDGLWRGMVSHKAYLEADLLGDNRILKEQGQPAGFFLAVGDLQYEPDRPALPWQAGGCTVYWEVILSAEVFSDTLYLLRESYVDDPETGSKPGPPLRSQVRGSVQPFARFRQEFPDLADGRQLDNVACIAILRYVDLPEDATDGFELEWRGRVYTPTQPALRWNQRHWFVPLAAPR